MSSLPRNPRSGANGYANGYSAGARYGQPDGDDQSGRGYSSERSRDRRPGGYGGFDDQPEYQDRPRVARPTSIERRREVRRSGEFNSRSRSRTTNGRGGDASKQIEEVLDYIQKEWTFMTTENCTPVQVALKLLDSSSLGLAGRQNEFQGTHGELQTALKAIVNEHHQGFNSSIGTFHKIQNSLQQSQQRVRTLKESLVDAKGNLSTAKPELKAFAAATQSYDEMLQVLSSIEQLQHVPERLEIRISEKRFLPAVDVLQDALRLIRKSEMENIGALGDLRVYLSNQEHSLADILIEELHNHLYLKSPYCEDRWKAHAQNQPKSGADGSIAAIDSGRKALYHFLDGLDMSEALVDDASRNPEADTFHYIQVILEALNKMSRLDIAIESITQRMPVELFRVVERSNTEVAQRHPSLVRGYASKGGAKTSRSYESDETRATLLNDLLWTLYARFEAIAESHRVVHDVVAGISKRDGLRDVAMLTSSFKELWKLYQSEMRSLLHDYLSTDGSDVVTSTLTSFLDDFLVNVFHPQLDETLMDLCAQTFMEADTFQEDAQWQLHSKKPIFKSTELVIASSNYQSLQEPDLINDRKSVAALCLLYTSMLFNEPDADVLRLNSELSDIDEEIGGQLMQQQHNYITHGIGSLADTLLVRNSGRIGRMNENGCGRMQLNILVLQQNLKNIEAGAVLTKATQYYNMFTTGPESVVAVAKQSTDQKGPFTYDELKVLVELYYSEDAASERREVAMKAKTGLNDYLLQLSEHMWQS
ncbi:Exocyst complex component sec8 [Neofusicoccum parvum]|nr:Exocyst complex component sec8 [Neofusicoccum parvum]